MRSPSHPAALSVLYIVAIATCYFGVPCRSFVQHGQVHLAPATPSSSSSIATSTLQPQSRHRDGMELFGTAHTQPRTYVSIPIKDPATKEAVSFLADKDDDDAVNALRALQESGSVDLAHLEDLEDKSLVFRSTDSDSLESFVDLAKSKKVSSEFRARPKMRNSAAAMYVNLGSEEEPVYVKHSRVNSKKTANLEDLRENGKAFTNVNDLVETENVITRASAIATRVKEEFPYSSDVWKSWTDKTAQYDASTLEQVLAEYFQEQSIGDIGGKEARYDPRPGFPGTLQPGQNFKEVSPIDSLPNKILHPWLAMQQIPFHVRWAPGHPAIFPVPLFLAFNDRYSDKTKNRALEMGKDVEIQGGQGMEGEDACRIAHGCEVGLSYEPSEQLTHGGMLFDNGVCLPHYNPDHGPTHDDAKPVIAEELRPMTELWYDPSERQKLVFEELSKDADIAEEVLDEEQLRRIEAEKLIYGGKEPAWQVAEEKGKTAAEAQLQKRYEDIRDQSPLGPKGKYKNFIDDMLDGRGEEENGKNSQKAEDQVEDALTEEEKVDFREGMKEILEEDWRDRASQDTDNDQMYASVRTGRTRSPRRLANYIVEFIDTMEQAHDYIDDKTVEKKGRRRKTRKKASPAEDEESVEDIEAVMPTDMDADIDMPADMEISDDMAAL